MPLALQLVFVCHWPIAEGPVSGTKPTKADAGAKWCNSYGIAPYLPLAQRISTLVATVLNSSWQTESTVDAYATVDTVDEVVLWEELGPPQLITEKPKNGE